MSVGMVGIKKGMTRVFQEDGNSVAVTVIELLPMRITQLKNKNTDGYHAVQVTAGSKKVNSITKPLKGHFEKAGVLPGQLTFEFPLEEGELSDVELGQELSIGHFEKGQKIDVRGITIGKGFAGGVKRHHFRTQDATHGNSLSHRANGSIGQCQTPGRVFKGKKMSGHMGNVNRTQQGLKIERLDADKNLLLVSGSVSGAAGGIVFINTSVKQKRAKK